MEGRAGSRRGISGAQVWAFAAAMGVLLVALASPLEHWSDALFSLHMVQHLLLILIAAPLLVMSDATLACLWLMPTWARRAIGRLFRSGRPAQRLSNRVESPVFAFSVHTIVVWGWHLPRAYDAAVSTWWLHIAEHVSFLSTSMLFWWPLVARRRPFSWSLPARLVYLFAAMLSSTVLGALLASAATPWYQAHRRSAPAWGLTALEDQQLAGLLMWMPGGIIYLAALIAAAMPQLSPPRSERPVQRRGHRRGTAVA